MSGQFLCDVGRKQVTKRCTHARPSMHMQPCLAVLEILSKYTDPMCDVGAGGGGVAPPLPEGSKASGDHVSSPEEAKPLENFWGTFGSLGKVFGFLVAEGDITRAPILQFLTCPSADTEERVNCQEPGCCKQNGVGGSWCNCCSCFNCRVDRYSLSKIGGGMYHIILGRGRILDKVGARSMCWKPEDRA